MSNVKLWLLVLSLLIMAGAMLADLSTKPRSKFTAANYDRLEIGMSMDEVVAILGEPDGIDRSFQDMAWANWYSPFDAESSISGIFVMLNDELRSKEFAGQLPDRPLLLPEVKPERVMPMRVLHISKHAQSPERRATLMLDPPKTASTGPILP